MTDSTEFEAIFFALDESGKAFLLETGRSLVRRTEARKPKAVRPKLSLVPSRLLKPAEDSIDSTVELIPSDIVRKPEGGQ